MKFVAIAYNLRDSHSGANDSGEFATLAQAKAWAKKVLATAFLSSNAYVNIRDEDTRATYNTQVDRRGRTVTKRYAFNPRRRGKRRVVARRRVRRNPRPLWEYEDARGVKHRGHLKQFFDYGGTDVTYQFEDEVTKETSMVSGSRLKRAKVVGSTNPKRQYTRRNPRRRRVIGRIERTGKRTRRNPHGISERVAWNMVLDRAKRINARSPNAQADKRELVNLAKNMLAQLVQGIHENPELAIVGALNPPLGTAIELRYKRVQGQYPGNYRHKFTSRAIVLAMKDGSLRIVGR